MKPQVAKELGKTQVDRGWRNVPQTQAQQLRQQYTQQSSVPKNLAPKPLLPTKPQIQAVTKGEQHPANVPGKGQQPPNNSELKPFVQKPANQTPGEQQKFQTEKKTGQPENMKPGEPVKRPPAVAEEKKVGTEAIQTEKPKINEVRKGEGEHPQQNSETRRAPATGKPAAHEQAPTRKKEETKKEPAGTPQAKASHKSEQRQSHPQVAQVQVSQPHVAQPHAAQPHAAQASHPKPNPPPQKKKDEHKG